MTPNASLLGHVAGILAGLLHVYVLEGAVPGNGSQGGAGWLRRHMRAMRNWRQLFHGVSHPLVRAAARDPSMLVLSAAWSAVSCAEMFTMQLVSEIVCQLLRVFESIA